MRGVLAGVVILALGCWFIGRPWRSPSGQKSPARAAFLCSLNNLSIDESSGIAASTQRKGVYWTHNDSGGKPEIYAFDLAGNDLGTFTLSGINARDWEDIASRKLDGTAYLYVGDIGDNMKNQKTVRVYRFPEPSGESKTITEFDTYTLRYPDGSHNCETLMVSPSGDLYMVTKDEFGDSAIYSLAAPARTGSYTLTKAGEIKLEAGNVYSHMVTSGDISPDGRAVVIRTYFSILLYRPAQLPNFSKSQPVSLPVPVERQGEAICFDSEGRRLITTSEGRPCRVSSVSLP